MFSFDLKQSNQPLELKGFCCNLLIQKFKIKKSQEDPKFNEHISIDEIEQDNIIADLKTGLNLDKIPNYLSDMLQGWEANSVIDYRPIYLPFHVELEDVEAYLGGEIQCPDQRDELKMFLKVQNDALAIDLNEQGNVWTTYEPTLARYLSKSTITYYDQVIQGAIVTAQMNDVINLLK